MGGAVGGAHFGVQGHAENLRLRCAVGRGMPWPRALWQAAALLLAWASALPSVAQQRPADPDLPGPTMTLVRKSTERIQGDYMDVTRLPKTISIDPLTPGEILEIQRIVYRDVMRYGPNITDSWQRAPEACMQWIFLAPPAQ